MKKNYIISIFILLFFSCTLQASATPFYKYSHAEVTSQLKLYQKKYPNFYDRLSALVLARLGTPYSLGCLGEEDVRGSLFRTDKVDCTVFVLTTYAMALSDSYGAAHDKMALLNYHNPPILGKSVISYANRNHFTYDRLHSSKFFRDITPNIAFKSQLRSHKLTLNEKSDGTNFLPIPWKRKVVVRYIPIDKIDLAMLSKIDKKIVGVDFVREKMFPFGIAIAHEGFLYRGKYLIHADSIAGRVMKTDFLEYIHKNSDWFDGVVFFEFNYNGDE